MRLPPTLSSLRIRNYRLWFTGQVISVAGTWTQTVAQAVLVLRLSNNNGIAAGAAVAMQYLPTLLFGVWGGLLADRVDKRRLLMVTQAALALVALAIAIIDLTGVVELWSLYVLLALSGAATAIDQPARASFVTELVGPESLPNALGLNSSIFNGARIVGPAVAAGTIVVAGTGGCFLLNALSYIAILIALSRMRTDELQQSTRLARGRGQVREGMRYAWSQPLLRSNLLLMTMVGTFAFNYSVVFPLIAKVTFRGGDGTVSTLFIAQGVGALAGALLIATLGRANGRRIVISTALLGTTMLAAAAMPSLGLFLAMLPIVGIAQIFAASSSNAMIQLDAAPSMRGRVTSLRTLTVIGSTPIGGMVSGVIARTAGPRWALAAGGIGCFVGLLFAGVLLHDTRAVVEPVGTRQA